MNRSARIRAQRQAALYAQDRARVSAQVGSLHEREVAGAPRLGAGAIAGPSGPVGCDANGAQFEPRESISDEARKRARVGDPASSHRAAYEVTASGRAGSQRQQVYDALVRWDGSSSKQLAHLSGLDRFLVARRLPEMERDGIVKRYEPSDGSDCIWHLVRRPRIDIKDDRLSS